MPKLRSLDPLVREIDPVVKDVRIENTIYGDLVRPELLPKPSCEVWLICGPPASGKSTYVSANARKGDIVIDVDAIAREYGMGRERLSEATAMLLLDRNERLAALATEPPTTTAWVIMGGASEELRRWWCNALGVEPDHLIVLVPPRAELYRRIMGDPDRRSVQHLHMQLVDKWFMQNA
jgi:5-methylcytosine-specific restriction protein A